MVLLLLAFVHFPKLERKPVAAGRRRLNLAVAVLSGAMVSWLSIRANGTQLFEPISQYFIETARPWAAGGTSST